MKKVALDIDDVLAGFYTGFCKFMNVPEKQINIWDGQGESKFVADNCHLADQSELFWIGLDKVSNPESISFDIECYITSSPPEMIKIRKLWLKMNGFPDKPVHFSDNKLLTLRNLRIDILVDDKISTVNQINASGDKIALQFKPPYMSAEIDDKSRIITHLSEVSKFL